MNYEKIISDKGFEYIQVINEDKSTTIIPVEESNSDYQAYLVWLEENK
jgi:hypothetical protein